MSYLLLALFALFPFYAGATTTPATVGETKGEEAPTEVTDEYFGIESLDFPGEAMWHNRTEGVFTWSLPEGTTAVAVELASSSTHEPLEVYKPPISTFTVTDGMLKEGLQFLTLQFKVGDEWEDIYSYHLLIDHSAPEPFLIESTVNTGEVFPHLTFSTTDEYSGLDRYEILLPNHPIINLTPLEARNGYTLSDLADGNYTVMVKAYDKAGNMAVSSTVVTVAAGWTDGKMTSPLESPWIVNASLLFLLLIVALELLYIWYLQRQSVQREACLRKEADEVEKQMHKVFSALRDEVFDQIRLMTKRTKLTKKEKEVVNSLNKALEVSELLIEKEVDDVKEIDKKK